MGDFTPDGRQNLNFQEIVRPLEQSLRRYLEHYVGNKSVADDLLQETLLKINKGLASFEGRSSIKTWAYAIANRVGADYLRHPMRQRKIVELDETEDVIDSNPGVDEQMIIGQMNACIRQVIDSLPAPYRTALILYDLEELTAKQTAEIIDCSLAAVKIRIYRARLRLKEALENQCDFYHDPDNGLRCKNKAAQ